MKALEKLPHLLAAQDWAAAEKLLKRAATAKAVPVAVLYNLGRVLMEQGKWAPARVWLRRAVQAAPDHAHAWFELARTDLELGDMAAALTRFERALALDPADADARLNAGQLAVRLGQYATAVTLLRPLAGHSAQADAWLYRATAEARDPQVDLYRRTLWARPDARALALTTAARVSKGQLPLTF